MQLDGSTKRRWLWLGILVALFTFLALVSAVQAYVSQLIFDKPVPWSLALRRSFKDWYACGVIAAGILWWCGRLRLEPGRIRSWVLAHVASGLVFSGAYIALLSWLLAGEVSVQTGEVLTFGYLFEKFSVHYILMGLILYWIVVFAHLGWHYYCRYREREMQAAELQRELVEARLAALRMQLNPHFLFNTLHALSALIHENPEAADRVVARLSELLRLSLDQTKPQEVPLSEELAFLDRYLEIEQTRFGDRLQIEKEVPADVHRALVPYLILQPLVENAIRHGIEPREETGRLVIRARRLDGTLELRVSDNGSGLPSDSEPIHEGIGLLNTRSRLRHLYAERGELELRRLVDGGLEVRLAIPYRTEAVSQEGP